MHDQTTIETGVAPASAPLAYEPNPVSDLSCEVQSLLRRIDHLCAAIDDATDELHITDERTRTAVDRAQVFVDLIRQAASEAIDKAEDIERRSRRAGGK